MSYKSFIASLISAVVIAGLSLSILSSPSSAEIAAIIIVSPTEGLVTDENGGFDSFTIMLDGPPTHPVKITLETSDPTEGTVSSSSVTFNKNNWDTPKEITVIGLADGIQDGDVDYQITGLATSSDPDFDGLVMPAVSVTNLNDAVPVANEDNSSTSIDTPVIVDVLENDTALDDVPLTLTIESLPSNGDIEVNPDNTITFTPDLSFTGDDQFSYQVCDADGDCAAAYVIIDVLEDQTPPSIEWISPAHSGEIYDLSAEEVYLEVEASDNFQVNCIEFFHWDAEQTEFVILGIDCELGYGITVKSGEFNYGWNQIFARADDKAGNLSEFKHIWLYRMATIYLPLVEC